MVCAAAAVKPPTKPAPRTVTAVPPLLGPTAGSMPKTRSSGACCCCADPHPQMLGMRKSAPKSQRARAARAATPERSVSARAKTRGERHRKETGCGRASAAGERESTAARERSGTRIARREARSRARVAARAPNATHMATRERGLVDGSVARMPQRAAAQIAAPSARRSGEEGKGKELNGRLRDPAESRVPPGNIMQARITSRNHAQNTRSALRLPKYGGG